MGAGPVLQLDDSFARELPGLHRPWAPTPVRAPELVIVNDVLAAELGVDADRLRSPDGVALLSGNAVPAGVTTVAQAYAGHQFGGYSPRLGDGRALLLGELDDTDGVRHDVHLKGSGSTPFARGGDGRAALGPMLREYVIGEAMHALGIPTTRILAVVSTGEPIVREVDGRAVPVPGAIAVRIASSHLRVGTFQYASATGDLALLRSLTDYAIARHAPDAADADNPALALYEHVVGRQASLIAQWMAVGFVHGVMNTDNMTISGETIDYGPCAFLETYDTAAVFSSIDHGGRYAYGNQPAIAVWNLARLAEALLPVIDDDRDRAVAAATEVLQTVPGRIQHAWTTAMRAKLGLPGEDHRLIADLLELMQQHRVDYTGAFRSVSAVLRGDPAAAHAVFGPDAAGAFEDWTTRWRAALGPVDHAAVADGLDARNPVYIARNHLVEPALTSAAWGDLTPLDELLAAVTRPFERRHRLDRFEQPAPLEAAACYRTFCGT
jgi:uncharacterized protein YdiU (UPF0061 family)